MSEERQFPSVHNWSRLIHIDRPETQATSGVLCPHCKHLHDRYAFKISNEEVQDVSCQGCDRQIEVEVAPLFVARAAT